MSTGFDDRNVIPLFRTTYEQRFNESWALSLALYNPDSDSAVEEYGLFGGFPKMREWLGARQTNIIGQKSYEIRNKPYEATLAIPERLLTRDKSGLLTAYMGNFASGSVLYQWEDLITTLVNANGTCYDGQAYFSASHSWEDSGTQTNLVTTSDLSALGAVSTSTDPTPTEMANVIMALVGHMLTFKDNKGRYCNGSARQFQIAVSTVPLFTAVTQAITASLLTGPVDNPLNGMKIGGFQFAAPLLLPDLSSATAKVRIFRTDGELKPFILQEEQGIQYELLGRGSDYYFENKAIKLGVDTSRGAGYGLWEHAIDGTLS